VSGDQTLLARITSVSDTSPAAKAGVMFRGSDAAGSIFASLTASPSRGIFFQWRSRTGGNVTTVNIARVRAPTAAKPLWLEIVRTGDTFTAADSTDGITFKRIGKPVKLTRFAATALAGLAVTAHKATALSTATFDDVAL